MQIGFLTPKYQSNGFYGEFLIYPGEIRFIDLVWDITRNAFAQPGVKVDPYAFGDYWDVQIEIDGSEVEQQKKVSIFLTCPFGETV